MTFTKGHLHFLLQYLFVHGLAILHHQPHPSSTQPHPQILPFLPPPKYRIPSLRALFWFIHLLEQWILSGAFSDIISDHVEGDHVWTQTCFSIDNCLLLEQNTLLSSRSSLREWRLIGKSTLPHPMMEFMFSLLSSYVAFNPYHLSSLGFSYLMCKMGMMVAVSVAVNSLHKLIYIWRS